eukprot:jgi/Astpho2/2616/fgenesh1_pg.00049_%23_2_t
MHTQMIDRSHKQQEADIRREAQLKGEIGAAEQEIDAAKAHLKVATSRKRDRDAEEVLRLECMRHPKRSKANEMALEVEKSTAAVQIAARHEDEVHEARAQQLCLLLAIMDDTQKLFEMDADILELAKAPAPVPPELEGPSCGASPQRDDTSQPSASRGASPMQQDDID